MAVDRFAMASDLMLAHIIDAGVGEGLHGHFCVLAEKILTRVICTLCGKVGRVEGWHLDGMAKLWDRCADYTWI